VTYNSDTASAEFIPSSTLSPSTTYTASITTGMKDLAGNALAANYTRSFTTESASITPTPVTTASLISTPTSTPMPVPTPTAIPPVMPSLTLSVTPAVCNAELISVSPGKLRLKKEESENMMVMLTGG